MFTMTVARRWLTDAAVAAVLVAVLAGPAIAEPTKITFLHVNDIYEIAPKDGQGGLAELMTLLRSERASAADTVTTFGGDLISPSVLSSITKGKAMVDLMNALGVDVAVLGNHEFDFGPAVAAQRVGESKFPWLGANVLTPGGKVAVGARDVFTVRKGDLTIGFFGVLTPDTDIRSSPGEGIDFADVLETADAAVKKLTAAGADLVVALTHLPVDQDRDLAASVAGIHLVLGGHDHEPITFYEGGVLIHKSGRDAHFLGAIDLLTEWREVGGKKQLRVQPAWRMISTVGVKPDPEIKKMVDRYGALLEAELGVVIARTAVDLDTRRETVRGRESAFGNLVADVMKERVGAEVALLNGGAIRGDRTYGAGSALTRKDILAELPFGNVIVLLELAGVDLLAALENGVSGVGQDDGRFPQVAGMTFVYDPAAPGGSRIVEAAVEGDPIEDDRLYRVATNEYLAAGGDGYESLKNGDALIDPAAATLVATAVMDYLGAKKAISPKVEGRIRRK